MVGIFRILNTNKWYYKLLYSVIIFIGAMGILLFTDYVNVKNNHVAPRFRLTTTTTGNVIYYDTLFYDVYRCNFDEDNEYWVVDKNRKNSIEELMNYCK